MEHQRSSGDDDANAFKRIKGNVMDLVYSSLRPEFINRIDEFVVFNALGKKETRKIVELEINKVSSIKPVLDASHDCFQLNKRLAACRPPVRLFVPDDVLENLARQSFDPQFGARPIRRQVLKSRTLTMISCVCIGSTFPGNTAGQVIASTCRQHDDRFFDH